MNPDELSKTFWIHKKTGARYFLVYHGITHTETNEAMVLYVSREGHMFTRPQSMFFDGRFEKDPDQSLWNA